MIYAVNKITKVHRIDDEGAKAADEKWVRADDDGWIPWHGGECPLPDGASHDVKFRDAITLDALQNPESWYWHHKGVCADIIAYRPILDEPEAPEWNGKGLPPVGVECEWKVGTRGWRTGHIIATFHDRAWLATGDDLKEQVWNLDVVDFRPIRTAEDRAVEAIEAAHKRGDKIGGRPGGFREIYRAIRAGDVPGVTTTA